MKKVIAIISSIFLLGAMVGCSSSNTMGETKDEKVSKTEIFMGTAITITLYNGENEEIFDKVFDKIYEIESLVSINDKNTEINNLNDKAGIEPVKLSDTSYYIVKKALEYSKISEGGYDLTIGPLVKLWSIGLPEQKVPTKEEIDNTIKKIDYSKVEINDETKEVFLKEKGMMIDLGSIAKGYAADEIVNILKQEDVKQAIINLGGNIYAMGLKNNELDWTIGIQNPFSDRGDIVGSVSVHDKSVVTSGVYERFIEEEGVRYHHILNPKTGYPYESEIAGISIISDKSIDGDALSTLIFTKGVHEGIELVEQLEGIDAIFITNKKEVYLTSGLKNNFNITNDSFNLIE